ncbi:hypothetical protein Pcinc_035366 [Petrolisthes cinctipes]|uniref:Uncharacterized protein n=1 Tax=Petrolisthes cinctipes TaxID=88211 RepID=A0AAE1BX17_PETCI|nr:hypothetical protein Pcinc_035366 [Petrolisthes cinctipes]
MIVDFGIDSDIVLRHGEDVNRPMEPRFYREAGRRAFVNCSPRLYNDLPANVKAAETVDIFKKRLKTFLFTDAYDLYNAIKEFCSHTKDTCQPGPIGPEGPMGPWR